MNMYYDSKIELTFYSLKCQYKVKERRLRKEKESKIYVIRGNRNVVALNLRFTRATSMCFMKNNSVKIENNDHGRE